MGRKPRVNFGPSQLMGRKTLEGMVRSAEMALERLQDGEATGAVLCPADSAELQIHVSGEGAVWYGGPENAYQPAVMNTGCQSWVQPPIEGRGFDRMMHQLIFPNFFPVLLWSSQ